jgi:hypothetical protein
VQVSLNIATVHPDIATARGHYPSGFIESGQSALSPDYEQTL